MGRRYFLRTAGMTGLLAIATSTLALPAQGSLTRLHDPLTGQPTDILYDFDRPGVFTSVGPGGTLDILFHGRDTQGWLVREGPAAMQHMFGHSGWLAPTFEVETGGYVLRDVGARSTDILYVTNLVDCGPWRPAETSPVPYLGGAHLHTTGHLGFFRPPCTGFGHDALALFDAPWQWGGRYNDIEWSFVRLALR